MQITLIQSEIEQALKNYINDIMSVKDGMEIEIQLKATRGEEGTTAIIDIVPLKTKPARAARVSGETSGKSDTVRAAAAAPAKAEPVQAAAVEAEPVAESVAEAEADDAEQVAEQAQEPEAQEPAPVEAEQAPAEEAPRKSLFAGLSKPQN